jgi:hypothetical protein
MAAPIPRPPPVTTQIRHLDELDTDPVRVDHVHDLPTLDRTGVRGLDRRHEPRTVGRHSAAELVDVVHHEAEVPRARVPVRRVDRDGVHVAILEDLEAHWAPGDRHLDDLEDHLGVPDESLKVRLRARPPPEDLEAEVRIEANGAFEVPHGDADVVASLDHARTPRRRYRRAP